MRVGGWWPSHVPAPSKSGLLLVETEHHSFIPQAIQAPPQCAQMLLWMLGIALRDKGNPVKTVMRHTGPASLYVALEGAAPQHQHPSPTPLPSEAGLDTDRGPHPSFCCWRNQAGAWCLSNMFPGGVGVFGLGTTLTS